MQKKAWLRVEPTSDLKCFDPHHSRFDLL